MQDAAPAAPASAARPAASRRQVPTNILDKLFYHGKKAALNLTDTNTKIVNVPRGDPKFVYLLYYMHILAFTLYEVLEYAEPGSGLSQSLKDLIINDHAKSAAGEVWRFATCTFLHPTPFQLFLTLATLNTLAFELESLLG